MTSSPLQDIHAYRIEALLTSLHQIFDRTSSVALVG